MGKRCSSDDNLPGFSWQSTVDTSQIKSEHAVSAMIRLVNENPGLCSIEILETLLPKHLCFLAFCSILNQVLKRKERERKRIQFTLNNM